MLAVALTFGTCAPACTETDSPTDPCNGMRSFMDPCGDAGEDRDIGYRTGIPASCVSGLWQFVGLGRCDTDADCGRWSGTEHVPAGADPPYARCVEYPPTGERFCESFREAAAATCFECTPGYPCMPGWGCWPFPSWNIHSPGTHNCVRWQTREATATAPAAHITACIEGTPDPYVAPGCY